MADFENFVDEIITEADTADDANNTAAEEATKGDTQPTETAGTEQDNKPENQPTKADDGKEGEPTTAEPTLTVKFRHEVKDIPISQAAEYAQKGMLYDDEGIAETMNWIKDMAKQNGYSSHKEYLEAIKGAYMDSQAKKIADEQNVSPDVAKKLVEKDEKIKQYEAEKEAKTEQQREHERAIAEIDEFTKMFPDVDVKNLPKEVLVAKYQNKDVPLAYHYAAYKAKSQEIAAAVEKKQRENAAAATPPLKSSESDSANEVDDVLKSIF